MSVTIFIEVELCRAEILHCYWLEIVMAPGIANHSALFQRTVAVLL